MSAAVMRAGQPARTCHQIAGQQYRFQHEVDAAAPCRARPVIAAMEQSSVAEIVASPRRSLIAAYAFGPFCEGWPAINIASADIHCARAWTRGQTLRCAGLDASRGSIYRCDLNYRIEMPMLAHVARRALLARSRQPRPIAGRG